MTQPQLTKNQSLVFDALSQAGAPLSAYGILDLLRDKGFRAPLQVYRALDKLVEEPAKSHIMNCGYSNGFSVQQVLDAVDRVTNMKLVRVIEGRRAGDPDALIADNARIKATLPWQPRFEDLDTIVTHALAWERKLTDRRG